MNINIPSLNHHFPNVFASISQPYFVHPDKYPPHVHRFPANSKLI